MRIGKATITTLAVMCAAGFATSLLATDYLPVSSGMGSKGGGEYKGGSTLGREICEWALDDGAHENSLGLDGAEWDMAWGHWWDANDSGCGWVTTVQIAWGNTLPTTGVVMIFNDPNNDGDPSDILAANDLLASVNVISAEENTGTFIDYPVGQVAVDGVFFITVVGHGFLNDFPAAMDETAPPATGVAWLNYNMDPADPWTAASGPILMEGIGLPCEWMLRALGTDEPPQADDCPWDNYPYPGGDGNVNIDDLFGVLGHWGPCVDPDDCPWDCHPDNGGGSYGDDNVNIDDLFAILGHWGPCPSDPKACCFPDGSCQDLTETECIDVGGTYYGYYGTCAEFTCPQPPENDSCELAEEVLIGSTITGDTTGMANPFIDGCVVGAPMHGPTLWYYVIGDGNTLTASLCNEGTADWDHVMSVFCGNCGSIMEFNMYCAGGNDVACQVPGENIWAPEVEWCTEEGVQYWIAIYGPGETPGNFGEFAMSVVTDGVPCGNPP